MRKSVNCRAVVSQQRVLRAGDTLLLLVPDSWVQAQRLGNSFALLGRVARYTPAAGAKDGDIGGGGGEGEGSGGGGGGDGDGSTERRLKLGASALALLLLLRSLSPLSIVSLFPFAVTLSYFLIGAGCITLGRSIGYRLIFTIACFFGPGRALTNTGVSAVIGAALVELQVLGPWGFLLCTYLVTPRLPCLISSSATV